MYFSALNHVSSALSAATGLSKGEIASSITVPKPSFGDLSSSVCFSLAKQQKKNPAQLATEIAKSIKQDSVIKSCQPAGPYLNFTLTDSFVLNSCLEATSIGKAGSNLGMGKKVLVEFPSVNPNKPWHIGHLRNALLGDAVARLLEFANYKVEREDYIDDLGLQVAQSLWGVLNLPAKPEGKFDQWLGHQYVEVAKRFEAKEIESDVRRLLHEIEHGNGETAKKSREIVERCVKAQYQTSYNYGICHDVLVFESDIVKNVFSEGLEKIKSSGAVVQETEGKNKGCLVAKLSGAGFDNMESPDKVLIRSDGTATYTGKDVVFQLWKFGKLSGGFSYGEFEAQPDGRVAYKTDSFSSSSKTMDFGGADMVINVIGMEQAYPQMVIRAILSKMGYGREAENSIHLSYEHATLPEGRFSGRAGTWIGFSADELLEEGQKRALARITKDFAEGKKREIADAVALGAIRFAFLRVSPDKKIVFEWDKALSMEGDSAPYIMYCLARSKSILAKIGPGHAPREFKPGLSYSLTSQERELARNVMLFEMAAQNAAAGFKPHSMADYALDLASSFNRFYATSRIAGTSGEELEARMAILLGSKAAIEKSLGLLGIPALDEM